MFLESPALLALSIAGRSGRNTLESMRDAMSNTWAETDLTDEVRTQELVELHAGLNPTTRAASQ
jgi:hypothetical protein